MSAIVTLVIVLATLAFGAVYPWGYLPLFAAAASIGLAGLARERGVPAASRGIAIGLLLVCLAMAAQLVPLPRSVLDVVSPGAVDVLSRYNLAFAGGRGPHALSVDPSATALGLMGLGALGVYAVGLPSLLSRRDLHALPRNLAVFAVCLAFVGIYFREHNNGLVYGFWMPQSGLTGNQFGPFVNRNHFGGWMVMTTCLAIGVFCAHVELTRDRIRPGLHNRIVWLSTRGASRIILMAISITVMAIALVWTLSRSAIVSFGCAVGCFIWLIGRRRNVRPLVRVVVVAALAAVLLASLNWRGIDTLLEWFGDTDHVVSRLAAWSDGWQVVRAFPLAGSGINTYPVVMVFFQRHVLDLWMTHAHNDYLQLLAEGGLLVTGPVLVLLWLLIQTIRRSVNAAGADSYDYWMRMGASVGIVAIGVQETVEFSLHIPANAFLFATLVAVAIAPAHKSGGRPRALTASRGDQ